MEGYRVDYYNNTKIIEVKTDYDKSMVLDFLKEQELGLDADVEYTIALLENHKIIGTGSLEGRVLKSIAVDPKYQGLNITNKIITKLINEAYTRGETHLFIYTKPKYGDLFENLGFYKIAEVPNSVSLLENKSNGIKSYVKELERFKFKRDKVAALVMNCNPFTLGHQYIIEKAAFENDIVHIFIVWEDRSSFPSEIRYNLVKEGTKHLSNVFIHRGSDYIISNATFPSYFIKEPNDIVETHAKLDLEIFKNYIAPALDINKRYIGEEPYCLVTRTYNKLMKKILPESNIEVEEIKRLEVEGEYISASKVRAEIIRGELIGIKNFLPEVTYNFLISSEGEKIIENMKDLNNRH